MAKPASFAAALALCGALAAPSLAGAEGVTLSEAVRGGDVAAVQSLLAQRADPNTTLPDTSTVLSWAVGRQDTDIVRMLLKAGARPDTPDVDGVTPLLLACKLANTDIVNLLLDAKANVRAVRFDNVAVLEVCAETAPGAVIERMIAAGAPVDATDSNGQTALMWASGGGNLDAMSVLLKHGADVNKATLKGFTPLFFAIKSVEPKATDLILASGGDLKHVSADGTNAVQLAAYEKKFALASMLVEKGGDVSKWDANGRQLLHVAAMSNQTEFAKVLLAHGAAVDAVSHPSTVEWRTEPNVGDTPIAKFVGQTPMIVAAQSGSVDVVKVLVEAGANKNFRGEDGTNLLLAASGSGSLKTLEYAIKITPDMSVKTDGGLTVMHMAIMNRRGPPPDYPSLETGAMLKMLVANGAPLEARDDRGRTLADVARRAQPDVMQAYFDIYNRGGVQVSQAPTTAP